MNIKNILNEFKNPFRDVNFPFEPEYSVDYKECTSNLEYNNEYIASKVAQKYNLIYRQGDAICTKTPEQLDDLKKAREEISLYMITNEIHWSGRIDQKYYFVFNS